MEKSDMSKLLYVLIMILVFVASQAFGQIEVKQFNADFCFIFGANLILDPVIENLPQNKINLHLGLSPWYKGAATLYWPFYNLKPQFCGVTFHQITKDADAGEIIHQCVPKLEYGDKITESEFKT